MDDETALRLSRALRDRAERLLTPALVIDLDAVEHNVRAVMARADGRWRPHIKTTKQSVVLRALFANGVRTLKCATLDELSLALATAREQSIELDILLAYPARGPMLTGALACARAYPRAKIRLLADDPSHLHDIERAAIDHPVVLEVFLDVDLGMGRTGTLPKAWAAALARDAARFVRLRIVGLHGYDGHLEWDELDQANAGYDALCELGHALERHHDIQYVVTSGTHSYHAALEHHGLRTASWRHEISPGTVVLSDIFSESAAKHLGLHQAAFVATRVVSVREGERITLDAGSKAIAPDCPAPACQVLGWPGLVPQTANEEHRPTTVKTGPTPVAGSLLFLVPDHVCTTVNLHRHALWIRTDAVVGSGPIEATGHSLWLDDVLPRT